MGVEMIRVPRVIVAGLSGDSGKTFVTLIDFYLVSPNIRVEEVKGINIKFRYSDHQPVRLKVSLE